MRGCSEHLRESECNLGRSLEYVRRARPRVVVVENVGDASAVGAISGLLGRLDGYHVEAGPLDPLVTCGEPMVRERHFWLLTSVGSS